MSTPGSRRNHDQGLLGQPSPSDESSAAEEEEMEPGPGLLLPMARSSLLAQRLPRLWACRSRLPPSVRRKREMTPADMKDATYWEKRQKNNKAAKRSREKRRLKDLMQESQLLTLSEENAQLRVEMLTLQCRINMGRGTSRSAANIATSPASIASTLALSPRPVLLHSPTPALFPPGLWGNNWCSPASFLGGHHGEIQTLGSTVSLAPAEGCFGDFDSLSPQISFASGQQSSLPIMPPIFSSSSLLSPRGALEIARSTEAEMATRRQVPSSNDRSSNTHASSPSASSNRAFLPTPTILRPAATLPIAPQPPQGWLMPRLSHPAVHSNLLLPWRSPCLGSTALYSSLPFYMSMEEIQNQGQCLGQLT